MTGKIKGFWKYIVGCAIYFSLTSAFLYWHEDSYRRFSDKFFVFQYMTVFSMGCVMISKYFNTLTYSRYGTRKKVIRKQLKAYCVLAIVLESVLFAVTIVCVGIQNGGMLFEGLGILVKENIRFFAGSYLFACIAMLWEYSGKAAWKMYAQGLTFLMLVTEMMIIIPRFRYNQFKQMNILFSWIFYDTPVSWFAVGGISIGLTVMLFWKCERKDWLL